MRKMKVTRHEPSKRPSGSGSDSTRTSQSGPDHPKMLLKKNTKLFTKHSQRRAMMPWPTATSKLREKLNFQVLFIFQQPHHLACTTITTPPSRPFNYTSDESLLLMKLKTWSHDTSTS